MRKAFIMQAAAAFMLTASHNTLAAEETAQHMKAPAPVVAQDHEALLASSDPKLAANKRLVYDMYRIVLQAGLADRAHEFIADDYIQHNPNAGQGLAGLVDYVKVTRPVREIKDKLDLPLVHLMAEGDYVTTTFVRPEKDANGETYYSSWFDLYRIENGKIAEHWDPMLKSDPKIDPNDKKL
ncbi:nuclear transport factor 2 family protein [Altererythrobacter fulvus]|uniref:nuclear transport factor 2 family protein n=1 Tax=Caenibius fulvus TaxID=2126012 RepID=UPI003015AD0F